MIHTGDCVAVMAAMEPESVDAIVTDPPYGLEFMGKEWDRLGVGDGAVIRDPATERGGFQDGNGGNAYSRSRIEYGRRDPRAMQAWHEAWAREALRVAKPGAHLLAFGGTRTYHRLAAAIEDAGWEIRDTLVYAYASGFPKSLNVAKQPGVCHCGALPSPEHEVRPVRDADVPPPEPDGTLLLSPLPQSGSRVRGSNGTDAAQAQAALWVSEPSLEGRGDVLQDARQLRRGQVRSRAGVGATDGPQGRLHHGAPPADGRDDRSPDESNGSGEPHRPSASEQRPLEPGAVADQRGSQARGSWPLCERCGEPKVDGWGTALKPAWEPIVLARKPLRGTVAGNVLAHGTGALNIDATRIGYSSESDRVSAIPASPGPTWSVDGSGKRKPALNPTDAGRWPANLLLTDPIFDGGVEGVVGGGEQESTSIPGSWQPRGAFQIANPTPMFYGDSGTYYSRFFLIPKAARNDREPVLRGQVAIGETLIYSEKAQGALPQQTPSRPSARENLHPTVKPVELMRHLVRLVTPPGGIVLDPFLGSGTTAIAAELEGFAWIGIEREAEYVAIAEARLNGTQRGLGLDVVAPTRKRGKMPPHVSEGRNSMMRGISRSTAIGEVDDGA